MSGQIEADSASILKLLNDQEYIDKYGFDKYTILALFIPNTYELWWNTNAENFVERMHRSTMDSGTLPEW